jgi:HAD superfamily hydrolase (TIGR01509 family)
MTAPIRCLLFDVMGTLVYDPFYREVPAFFGMSFEELLQSKHPSSWIEFERGEIEEKEFLPRFFRDGRAYDHAGLRRTFEQSFRYLDGMEKLLADLRTHGLPIHLLSNYAPWYEWIETQLQVSRFAEWSCVSCDTGVRKPDSEAYHGAARRAGFAVEDCLFVDDRRKNCQAAEDLGMPSLMFEQAAKLRQDLDRLGVLPISL